MCCVFMHVIQRIEIFFFLDLRLEFFIHNCTLGNGHFFQVVHFQEKLLKVELWVSRPPKSYD